MPWAGVPETPINKHHYSLVVKRKVRLSKMFPTATPASNPMQPKKFCQGNFRLLVAVSWNARHDVRALLFGENV
jgi:hypothetical protein